MDSQEQSDRAEERRLRVEELTNARESARTSARLARLTVIFSAIAVFSGIVFTGWQARSNDVQFRQNVRNTSYNNIVTGLGSSSGAVQVNSMRLLSQYVRDPANYDDKEAQQRGLTNAIQTLAAFIEDKSADTSLGLTNYESPQPIVLSRAMTQLKTLVSNPELGTHDTDISRANLHGISLPYLIPQGSFLAIATDFRRATLNNLNLTKTTLRPSVRSAFFTCAVLTKAKFGEADVGAADFSGADLSDADLSHVKNLRSEQLRGVTVTANTSFPKGMAVRGPEWRTGSRKCADVVDQMTGMLSGQGYVARVPCPLPAQPWGNTLTRRRFRGDMRDLVAVCTARLR